LVNNKTNQLQISLNTDIAGISNAISRAKSLTLQGVGAPGICGYGVTFAQGLNKAPDTYTIYPYTDCVNWVKGNALAGQGGVNNLSSGLRILNITSSQTNQFIKDVIFYSSDAKVKLFNFAGKSICESGCDVNSSSGIIVINTESMPTSYVTLKISTTGQVTSKLGNYSDVSNFNSASSTDDGVTEGTTFIEDTCIPNCFCASNLASGQTCPDGCGGICGSTVSHYACNGNSCIQSVGGPFTSSNCNNSCSNVCVVNPPNICDGKTCSDHDNCGAPCIVCDASKNQVCINGSCQTCSCVPDANGNTCGQCGGNCKGCAQPGYTCTLSNNVWSCTVGPTGDLKLNGVYPNTGFK
jgi:hypothetical protein